MGALIHAQFASLVGVGYHYNWLVILYLTLLRTSMAYMIQIEFRTLNDNTR